MDYDGIPSPNSSLPECYTPMRAETLPVRAHRGAPLSGPHSGPQVRGFVNGKEPRRSFGNTLEARISVRSPLSGKSAKSSFNLYSFHMLPEPAVLRYSNQNSRTSRVMSRSSMTHSPCGSPQFYHDNTPSVLFYPSSTAEYNDFQQPDVLYAISGDGRPVGVKYEPSFGESVFGSHCQTADVSDVSMNYLSPGSLRTGGGAKSDYLRALFPPREFESPVPEYDDYESSMPALSMLNADKAALSPTTFTSSLDSGSVREVDMDSTTVMLRNLPNRYTRDMVLQEIESRGLMEDIDFFYLPIDLRHRCNVGYCFINLVSKEAIARFRNAFVGTKLEQVKSGKTCEVGVGKVQGLEANIEAYRNSAVISMHEKYHPLLFENGVPKPFPPPTLSREELRMLKPEKKGVSTRQVKRRPFTRNNLNADTNTGRRSAFGTSPNSADRS